MNEKITKTNDEWRTELTREQYSVMREKGTEPAFTGRYYDSKDKGMYTCASCGTELFSSDTKFDSGTGWPSFSGPVNRENIELKEDLSHGMHRTEVLCKRCGGHLGHVFDDGPGLSGKRYCLNSCALELEKK